MAASSTCITTDNAIATIRAMCNDIKSSDAPCNADIAPRFRICAELVATRARIALRETNKLQARDIIRECCDVLVTAVSVAKLLKVTATHDDIAVCDIDYNIDDCLAEARRAMIIVLN